MVVSHCKTQFVGRTMVMTDTTYYLQTGRGEERRDGRGLYQLVTPVQFSGCWVRLLAHPLMVVSHCKTQFVGRMMVMTDTTCYLQTVLATTCWGNLWVFAPFAEADDCLEEQYSKITGYLVLRQQSWCVNHVKEMMLDYACKKSHWSHWLIVSSKSC